MMKRTLFALVLAAVSVPVAGCGGRAAVWSEGVDFSTPAFGLKGAVAVVDAPASRVVLLRPGDNQALSLQAIPVGINIVNVTASPDSGKLLVVSAGHRAAIGDPEPDQAPSLTVIDPTATPISNRYDLAILSDPLSGLAIDPIENRWAILYAGSGSSQAFVENPNEIVLIDLTQPPATATPVPYTLHSFGGQPVRFDFTAGLNVSGFSDPQRLLIVESDQDLAILRLEDPTNSETSIPLTSSTDTRRLAPAAITVDAGDPTVQDARIGVRVKNDSTVFTFDLAADTPHQGFAITPNLADVGGIPSDLAFVHTDLGALQLAALVPSLGKATLIDPVTSLTTDVTLPAAYQDLSLVTSAAGATTTTPTAGGAAAPDTALLWNGGGMNAGAAFWDLGHSVGQPYRSIQTIGVTTAIAGVLDVPANASNGGMLKVLETNGSNSFYVLDLGTRTAAPLITSTAGISLSISPKGEQVWTYVPDGTQVAATDFAQKHPHSLIIERPVQQVFEIDRGPSLDPVAIVLHDVGSLGATLYDAATLDDQTRRLYSGLLTGGPYQ